MPIRSLHRRGNRLRFAVRGPARRLEGSPRSHGTPCRGFGPHVRPRRGDGSARGTDHVLDLQIRDADQVEAAGRTGGGLLHPVLAPIGLAGREPADRRIDPRATIRPPLGARRPAPRPQRTPGLALARDRHRQQLAGGQDGRDGPTTIHAADLTRLARPAQPPMLMLPNRQIPHTPTTTTDILRRERRFLPGLKAGVSTPRNR